MSEFSIPVGSLEEQALKRKERLRDLKRKAETKPGETRPTDANENTSKLNLPRPDQILQTISTENEVIESDQQPESDDVISKMTNELSDLKAPFVVEEIDIQNLAPRKPDWDLKRDVSKKLERLDRRTQRAIAELIRERLQSNQGGIDLEAVNAVGYTTK